MKIPRKIAWTIFASHIALSFLTMAVVMLSGTFVSISKESVLYIFSRLSINTYAIQAIQEAVDGAKLSAVYSELAILAGVCVVVLVVSRYIFRLTVGSR